jgi:hypothetical protein
MHDGNSSRQPIQDNSKFNPEKLQGSMRKLIAIILVLAIVLGIAAAWLSHSHAGIHIENFVDRPNSVDFALKNYRGGISFGPCGPSRAVNWSYDISLNGGGPQFAFDDVHVNPDGLGHVRIAAGDVVLDRQKRIIKISLKVAHGKMQEDFAGNGTFKFK